MGCSDSFEEKGLGKVELQGTKPEADYAESNLAITPAMEDSYAKALRTCRLGECPPFPHFLDSEDLEFEFPLQHGKRLLVCRWKIKWICSMAPATPEE